MQPRSCDIPIASGGRTRDLQSLSSFFKTQSAEVAKLHDTYLLLVDRSESIKRFVESKKIDIRFTGEGGFRVCERYLHSAVSSFRCIACASVIDKDVPHHLRREREKLRPALPLYARLVDKAQECFMDKRRGLK